MSDSKDANTFIPGSNIKPVIIANESKLEKTFTDLASSSTLYFKNCTDSEYKIESIITKIFVQNCSNLKINVLGKVITSTIEIWKCENVDVNISVPMKTLQVDLAKSITIKLTDKANFHSLIWAGCENLKLSFDNHAITDHEFKSDDKALLMGLEQMKTIYPKLDPEIDQFIARFVDDKLRVERIIRLQNGFPTTEREAKAHDDRQELALQTLAESMGIKLNKKKNPVTVGRNDPCICGSVRKYKKCCGYFK